MGFGGTAWLDKAKSDVFWELLAKNAPAGILPPGWGVKERAAASLQVSCPRQFVLHLLSYKFTRTHVLNLETSTFSGIHIL